MSHERAFDCPFGCNTKKLFKKQSSLNAHMAQCRMRNFGTIQRTNQISPSDDPIRNFPENKPSSDNDCVLDDDSVRVEENEDVSSNDRNTPRNERTSFTSKNSFSLSNEDDNDDEITVTGLPNRFCKDDFSEFGTFDVTDDHESELLNEQNDDNGKNDHSISSSIVGVHNQNQFAAEILRQEHTGQIIVYPAAKPKACRVPSDVALLDLARLLDKARCPNYMFDNILSWCRYASKVGCNPAVDRLPTRKAYFTSLEKRLASVNMSVPGFHTKKVILETAKVHSDDSSGKVESEINYWDFSEQLVSLLSDHSIFGDLSNLNVNAVNPFLPNRQYAATGAWYQDTIRAKNITGYDGNFLMGIVLAADRTGNTFNLRFGTEPLLFTLSIIKESLWHQPRVWRPLAMIPCDRDCIGHARGNLHSTRNEGMGSSCRNYHSFLRVALESLQRIQSPTYLYWPYNDQGTVPPNAKTMYRGALANDNVHELCRGKPVRNKVSSHKLKGVKTNLILGDSQRVMNVICCVSHIILDGEGADKITCRHKSSVEPNNRISRGCDCKFDESDNPFVDCCPVSQARIVQAYFQIKWSNTYMDRAEGHFQRAMVESCAVHPCENALWTIDFGASPNGLYAGPLTIDSLHAFEEGNNARILVLILGEQNSSHYFCAGVDKIVDQRLRNKFVPRQSGSKRLPRMCFSRGISSLSNLAANERVGVMCALTLVSISLESHGAGHIIMGRKAVGCPSDKRVAVMNRVVFCQLALLFHCWVDNGPHDILFLDNNHRSQKAIENQKAIQEAASLIGEYQKIAFPRTKGNGHQTQKFHDWYKHIIPSLVLAGNGRRIKADVTEKMHKYFCKAPGETALKHSQEVFLRGVCTRLTTTSMLNNTRAILDLDDNQSDDCVQPQVNFLAHRIKKTVTSFAHVSMSDTAESSKLIWNSSSTNRSGYDPFVRDMIVHGCHKLRDENLSCSSIVKVYTEINIEDTIFRCHPNYRKEHGPWFDWAMIKWGCQMKPHWKVAAHLWEPNAQAVNSMRGSFREVLLSLHDHLEDSVPFDEDKPPACNAEINIYVPARILAFVECVASEKDDPSMYAVIESCQSECYTDSLITRRWRKTPGTVSQRCIVVHVSAIACPCYIIEVEPGFPKIDIEPADKSLIVHEVFDRKTCWGKRFLEVVNRGLSSVCYQEVRKKLDQILKKKRQGRVVVTARAAIVPNMEKRSSAFSEATKDTRVRKKAKNN